MCLCLAANREDNCRIFFFEWRGGARSAWNQAAREKAKDTAGVLLPISTVLLPKLPYHIFRLRSCVGVQSIFALLQFLSNARELCQELSTLSRSCFCRSFGSPRDVTASSVADT